MRKLSLIGLLAATSAFGQMIYYPEDGRLEQSPCCPPPTSCRDLYYHPFEVAGSYFSINKLKLDKPDNSHERIRYAVGDARGTFWQCCDGYTAIGVGGGWIHSTLDWDHSPFFQQNSFDEVGVFISAFTSRMYRWEWKAHAAIWLQTEDMINLGRYGAYNFFLAGRYALCCPLGVHFGFVALTGKRAGFVRPVVGFDYTINQKWKINAVYPTNLSVNYCVNKYFTASAAARLFRTRERLRKEDPIPQGIWEYRGWGIEGLGSWHPMKGVEVEAFIGWMVESWIKVNNTINKRIAYRELKGGPYAGAHAELHF